MRKESNMKSLFIFSLLAVITALTGCKPEDFQDTGVLSIEDFYIIGSNDNALNEIPEIDPYFNDGEFLLFIRLGKPDLGYELTYYLGNKQSTQDATPIYHLDCDDDDRYCYDGDYFTLSCYYLPDMTGQCGSNRFNLSDAIFALPFSGYIIAEVCHRVQNQCVTRTQRVVFR